jgi:hypothetical protein
MLTREDAFMFREHLGVVPVERMTGGSPADTLALKRTYSEARSTMRSLGIVQRVEEVWFGGGIGDIVAVFLFRFVDLDGNEQYGWLVCGDIPWFFTPVTNGDFSKAILERYVTLGDCGQPDPASWSSVRWTPTQPNRKPPNKPLQHRRPRLLVTCTGLPLVASGCRQVS